MRLIEGEFRPIVAIIQARMSSTRLPGKVMRELSGRPVLWHVTERLAKSSHIDTVVIATTTDPSDDVIESWCSANNVACYRGSLEDVLDRYYLTARKYGAVTVVRVTSDCPLIDPGLVDAAIEKFVDGGYDYVGVDGSYPDGLDAEVFTFRALERTHREAGLQSELEHVTPYIWKHPDRFKVSSVKSDVDLSHLRWTLDDPVDLEFLTRIFGALYRDGGFFTTKDVLEFLEKNPELIKINSATMRNEGYAKSLKEDRTASGR